MADDALTDVDAFADVDAATERDAAESRSATRTEVYLGLLWLGITVFTAYSAIHGVPGGPGPVSAAVGALPDVISSALVAAASIAAAAGSRHASAVRRLLIGLAAGAAFGAVAAVGVRIAYGASSSIMILAITVAAAGVLGGGFAMLPSAVVDASLWAMTWVLFAGLILSVLKPNLVTMLGGGTTGQSRFILLQPAVAGLLAAMHSVRWLRPANLSVIWFLVAGALSGIYLLVTEGLGHYAGKLLSATPDSAAGHALFTSSAKIQYAVIVLAAGGVLALLIGARRPRD